MESAVQLDSVVQLDSASLHLAHGHSPYKKERIQIYLCASTT